jgi:hypothetical protein
MKRPILLVLSFSLAIPCLAAAQAPPPPVGPEVQRLAYWVGTWNYKSATASSTITYQWFTGGFSLIGREEGTGSAGKYAYLRVLTYDPAEKMYTHYLVTSGGPGGILAQGTVTGNTFNWEWKGLVNGKPAAYRGTMVEVSPTSAAWKVERSIDGGPWSVTTEGTSTKVK